MVSHTRQRRCLLSQQEVGGPHIQKCGIFFCGFNQAKHNFIEARQIPKEFDRFSLSGADIAIEDQNLIKLLLPDLYSRLGPISVKQALMHEGYQLR